MRRRSIAAFGERVCTQSKAKGEMAASGAWQCVFEMTEFDDVSPSPAPFLCLAIGGNIGAGKSTAIAAVRRRFADRFVPLEPDAGVPAGDRPIVMCAPEAGGGTWGGYLAKFYRNPKKYAFRMHAEVVRHYHDVTEAVRMARRIARLGTPVAFLVERCPAEVWSVFVSQNRERFSPTQLDMIRSWADAYQHDLEPWRSATYVHVTTPPDVCAERVGARARPGEHGVVDASYLRALDSRLRALYADANAFAAEARVVSTDSDRVLALLCDEIDRLAVGAPVTVPPMRERFEIR